MLGSNQVEILHKLQGQTVRDIASTSSLCEEEIDEEFSLLYLADNFCNEIKNIIYTDAGL